MHCAFILLISTVFAIGNDLSRQCRLYCKVQDSKQFSDLVALVNSLEGDLWDESPKAFPATVTVRIHQSQYKSYNALFDCRQTAPLIVPKPTLKRSYLVKTEFFQDYRSFDDQQVLLKSLANRYPASMQLFSIGKSLEGRDLWVAEVTKAPLKGTVRRAIWVNGGQHAREWLSPAACLYLIQTALTTSGLLDKYDLIVAPNINPDGYEFSRIANRYWRKNKRHNSDGSMGVDLNRNWDFKWNQINGGGKPPSDVYPGTGPASEPEVEHTATFVLANRHRIAAGIDVHTFGEVVLRNYGWTLQPCKDEVQFKKYGDAMAKAAQQIYGQPYRSDRSAGLYPTSGSLDDWFYEKAGFPGFTFEMRDDGTYGFVSPAGYIVPNGMELVAAIKALEAELV